MSSTKIIRVTWWRYSAFHRNYSPHRDISKSKQKFPFNPSLQRREPWYTRACNGMLLSVPSIWCPRES